MAQFDITLTVQDSATEWMAATSVVESQDRRLHPTVDAAEALVRNYMAAPGYVIGTPVWLNVTERGYDCPSFYAARYGTEDDAPLGLYASR